MTEPAALAAVFEQAERTRALASRLAGRGVFTGHLEHEFLRAVEDLLRVARDVTDAAQATPDERHRLEAIIDVTVDDVERFISSHQAPNAKRLERNRHLVETIYDLRQVFESMGRRITPRGDM